MTKSLNRTYDPKKCITFRKTKEAYGGLSNMASGYMIWMNNVRILSTEALYQACRFPHMPEVQRSIIMQASPMTAKMKSKPFRDQSRADWDQVRVQIMRWCLRVKLAQNWDQFGELLLRTGDKPIVEDSRKDQFWGAVMNRSGQLEGRNALGRLLMELREELKGPERENLRAVKPLDIPEFLLYGQPIGLVEARATKSAEDTTGRRLKPLGTRRPDEPLKTYAPPATKANLFSEPEEPMQKKEPEPNTPLKPYPAYKPAGVSWLHQVPEHWEVLPNRALFTEVNESGRPEDEMLSVTIGRGVLKQTEHLANSTKKDSSRKDKSTYKRAGVNDIVYNKMRAWQGAFGMSRYSGIVSPAYVVQRPTSKSVAEFYHYVFRSPLFAKEAERNSYGLASDIWNLRPEHFKTILNICPPTDEQHLIVRYLHALDTKVKRYIRTKRSLIARLQEQKQAIIQRAVTRGLDPNVKLKPSGVEWLGEVPEHWEVRRVSSFCRVGNGSTPLRGQLAYWASQGFPWLNSASVNNTVIDSSTQFVTKRALKECHLPVVQPGSVLVAITGQGKTRGTAALLAIEATINQHIAYLAPKTDVCSGEYLREFLAASYGALREISDNSGSTKGALTCAQLKQFKVALPPPDEQQDILQHLKNELRFVNESLNRVQEEISLMLEYHTRLIADVVTGAVDVRTAAQALPDQPIDQTADEPMEEEPLSMAAEGEETYENE